MAAPTPAFVQGPGDGPSGGSRSDDIVTAGDGSGDGSGDDTDADDCVSPVASVRSGGGGGGVDGGSSLGDRPGSKRPATTEGAGMVPSRRVAPSPPASPALKAADPGDAPLSAGVSGAGGLLSAAGGGSSSSAGAGLKRPGPRKTFASTAAALAPTGKPTAATAASAKVGLGARARRFAAAVCSRAFFVAVLPVLLGLLLGAAFLRVAPRDAAHCGGGGGGGRDDGAAALLARYSGVATLAGSGEGGAAGDCAALDGVEAGAASLAASLARVPLLVLLFALRLALTALPDPAPGAAGAAATSPPPRAAGPGGGGDGAGAVLGGEGGPGGVLSILSQAMATWRLVKDLTSDLCALVFTALGVAAVGRALAGGGGHEEL